MRCLECKIAKFDDKQHKWVCPAHPYAEIDLYTVHRNCGANLWYPNYVRDRIECERVKLQSYKTYALVLGRAVEDGIKCNLPEKLQAELELLRLHSQLKVDTLKLEFEKLHNEIERLKKNGLA